MIPMLLSLLAISLVMTGFVHAAGDDPSTQNANPEMKVHRNITIDTNPEAVLIRTNVVNGSVENHIGILFTTAHGIMIHVAFSHETEVNDVENEGFLYLRIAYVSLTEFNDTDGNGALDSTDKVVQVISLQNLSYTPPSWKPILSQDNKRGVEIMSNVTDTKTGLFFGVVADIFPQYAIVNNVIVPPTATKITTTINHFPFKSTTDKLALQVRAVSATRIEQETPTSEQTIRVRSATAQGFYTWTPTAMVNGNPSPVVSSFTKAKGVWLINLAYPSGTSIVHDPLLGFSFGSTPIINASMLVGAAISSFAVFGLLVYAGRRQLAGIFSRKPISM